MKDERGFTLIEMMIGVAIIAILASILIPNFTRARAQAQTAACESNLKESATALELYYTDHQAYPNVQLQLINPQYTGLNGYLNQVPEDPAAGAGKYYMVTATTQQGATPAGYTVWCPGTHDPSTFQNISQSATDTHLKYDSNNGMETAASQGT